MSGSWVQGLLNWSANMREAETAQDVMNWHRLISIGCQSADYMQCKLAMLVW